MDSAIDTGGAGAGGAGRPLAFTEDRRPALLFLAVTALATPALILLAERFLPRTGMASLLFTTTAITLVAVVAWLALRREGVSLDAIGFGWRRVVPGVLTVAAVWAGAHVFGWVVLAVRGEQLSLGIPVGATATGWLATAVMMWVFVGIAEEFAFRGYLQNKVIAHVGGGTRARTAGGVLLTSALFSLWHIPQLTVVRGLSPTEMAPVLAVWAIYGIILGTVYELTRNVVLAGVLHGTFNHNPVLLLGPEGEAVTDLTLLVLPLLAVAVWYYRRWARTARPDDFRPQATRPETAGDA
ncbi:CPBP family intramembrane glutamic endopeptidase [Haloglomus salinum]|uniref:CPBP family intramembrane glutamic endopeptidase n=1 Tax=Haloglomus salinum TaxID=2962673 RepID=UPI0020C9CEFB|nr:type II CAAX endopeptidase family protein [Haloglomus salinum]